MCSIRYCHLIPPAVAGGIRLETSPDPSGYRDRHPGDTPDRQLRGWQTASQGKLVMDVEVRGRGATPP